jgi:1-acyl-sn-glycerol-3-phosphate acyltransferase
MMHLYIEALITLVGLKVEVSGLEKTPKSGRFLLVCNHQNESDPGILLHYFKNNSMPVGFIHVPSLNTMAPEQTAAALEAAIAVLG